MICWPRAYRGEFRTAKDLLYHNLTSVLDAYCLKFSSFAFLTVEFRLGARTARPRLDSKWGFFHGMRVAVGFKVVSVCMHSISAYLHI